MRNAMTPDAVYAVVRDAVVTVMEVDAATLTPGTRLVDDLRCDSLAIVEIAEVVEESIGGGFRIEDADLDDICTIAEAVEYVVGRLSRTVAAGGAGT